MQTADRFNSIQSIVLSRIARKREQTFDNYEYYEDLMFSYVRDKINLRTTYGVNYFRARVDSSANGQITMPSDYFKYIAVGIEEAGTLWTLTYDRSILTDVQANCIAEIGEENEGIGGIEFPEYYYAGRSYPAQFSLGGGFNEAYFNEDRNGRRIFINPRFYSKEIIVMYVSDGGNVNCATVIPAPYVEPAHLYMDYLEEISKNPSSPNADNMLRRFDIAMLKAQSVDSDLNYTRIVDVTNASKRQLKFGPTI